MPVHRKHISVHIEKTAGTSLRDALNSMYGPDKVFTYSPTRNIFRRSSEMLFPWTYPFIQRLRKRFGDSDFFLAFLRGYRNVVSCRQKVYTFEELPIDFEVLHGHFCADFFDSKIHNPIRTVVLREPLARMVSHFNHLKERKNELDWRINIPYSPQMTFEDFALSDEMKNYQAQAFGKYTFEDFDIVGTAENSNYFMYRLQILVKGKAKKYEVKRFNESPPNYQKKYPMSEEFVRKFKIFHARDYALWEKARENEFRYEESKR